MAWHLALSPRASRVIERLAARDRTAIEQALDRLAQDPGSADIKKLSGRHGEWRLRVGRWRVILEMDSGRGVISVTDVLPRDRAYRR